MSLIRDLFAKRGPGPFGREELLALMRDFYRLGALGTKIRKELGGDIRAAVRRGILDNAGGRYILLCRHIGRYNRDFLREQFLAAIGHNWIDRPEAIRQAARFLGFRRTGPAIQQVLRSAINSAFRRGELERDRTSLRRT